MQVHIAIASYREMQFTIYTTKHMTVVELDFSDQGSIWRKLFIFGNVGTCRSRQRLEHGIVKLNNQIHNILIFIRSYTYIISLHLYIPRQHLIGYIILMLTF